VLQAILEHAEAALAAPSAEAASAGFLRAMTPLGASYLQTRVYRRPLSRLTSATHFAAGGVISRISPTAWPGSEAFNYICFECNPLLTPIRQGRTRYRFSDFAPHDSADFGPYWDALSEADIQDAHCATSYGADGVIASLHLGFAHRVFSPEQAFLIQMAGLVLTERLMSLAAPTPSQSPHLTTRERDSLGFVADGKTDWEIGVILGVSEATARFHVDNARRKLGAVTRAQAVARLVNQGVI
jgi:LuxR family quorum sensing-dependent transcriptional regulator